MGAALARGWDRLRPGLPWLGLAGGLVFATVPAWRPVIFGVSLTVEDLTSIRCLPRSLP